MACPLVLAIPHTLTHTLQVEDEQDERKKNSGRAHEKWSCLISRAAAAVSFIHNQVKVSYLHGMAL